MNQYIFHVGPGFEAWMATKPMGEVNPPGEVSYVKTDHLDSSGSPLNEEITITESEESGLTEQQFKAKCEAFLIPFVIRYNSIPRRY